MFCWCVWWRVCAQSFQSHTYSFCWIFQKRHTANVNECWWLCIYIYIELGVLWVVTVVRRRNRSRRQQTRTSHVEQCSAPVHPPAPPNMVAWAAFAAAGSLLLKPLLALFLLIIFMASLGKSLGVRRFYVALLLRMFEVRSSADGRHVGLSLFRVHQLLVFNQHASQYLMSIIYAVC